MSSTNHSGAESPENKIGADEDASVGEVIKAASSDLIYDETPDEVGGPLDDDEAVQDCLTAAVEFLHSQLTTEMRRHICDKWGINNDVINRMKIGFAPADNSLVEYLQEQGFSDTTIARTGLAAAPTVKHAFNCTPSKNKCNHTVPPEVDAVAELRSVFAGYESDRDQLIEAVDINIDGVVEAAKRNNDLWLKNWWEARITFPYQDENGNYRYLIGRATDETEDRVYGNNIPDQTGEDSVSVGMPVHNEYGPIFDPAVMAVSPGTDITFDVESAATIPLEIVRTPDGVWWEDQNLSDIDALTCENPGVYLYRVQKNGHDIRGAIWATPDYDSNTRKYQIEDFLEEAPHYEIDKAKYIKQSVNKEWVNNNVVQEPMFGVETVEEDRALLITEGVTDAIMAQQFGIPCVSPCTTQFKQEHYGPLTEATEGAASVYIVMDSEENAAGEDGALKTAKALRNNEVDALVGRLPRPEGVAKIDVAEFLKTQGRDPFFDVLRAAKPPEEFDAYDPEDHDPSYTSTESTTNSQSGTRDYDGDDQLDSDVVEDALDYLDPSRSFNDWVKIGYALYDHFPESTAYHLFKDWSKRDSWDDEAERQWDYITNNAESGKATIGTVIYEAKQNGWEFPSSYSSSGQPSYSDEELWELWHDAKVNEADYPLNDEDSVPQVPRRAMWHVAREHDVAPERYIPESDDDDEMLPRWAYNKILEVIETEYGISDTGRTELEIKADDSESDSS